MFDNGRLETNKNMQALYADRSIILHMISIISPVVIAIASQATGPGSIPNAGSFLDFALPVFNLKLLCTRRRNDIQSSVHASSRRLLTSCCTGSFETSLHKYNRPRPCYCFHSPLTIAEVSGVNLSNQACVVGVP